MWNGLPEDTVKASTVNSFKGHFDRYCRINCFSMDWNVPGRHDTLHPPDMNWHRNDT